MSTTLTCPPVCHPPRHLPALPTHWPPSLLHRLPTRCPPGQYGEAAWLVVSMGRTLRAEEERRREGADGEGTGEAAAEASGASVQRHHLGQQAYERLRGGHERCEARLSQVCAKGQALQRRLRRSGFAYHWTLAWGGRCPLCPCPTTAPDCFPWDLLSCLHPTAPLLAATLAAVCPPHPPHRHRCHLPCCRS